MRRIGVRQHLLHRQGLLPHELTAVLRSVEDEYKHFEYKNIEEGHVPPNFLRWNGILMFSEGRVVNFL